MNAEELATELARRLTQSEAGVFRAHAGVVVLDPEPLHAERLQVIDAGTGRTEQVAKALIGLSSADPVPVIVGRHFSQNALKQLNDADANYMDDRHLRVRLRSPSMLIRLQDDAVPPQARAAAGLRLGGVAGGIALALLLDPAREWKVSDLAAEGYASLGAAQNTVVALEAEGLLERSGRGPLTRRRVSEPAALLDRYAHDAIRDRRVVARGYLLDDGTIATMQAVTRRLIGGEAKVPGWFTGVAAAQTIAPHVTAVRSFEMWTTARVRADLLLEAMGAMRVEEGANLIVMQGFKGVSVGAVDSDGVRRASVFRIYADALADPARGEEQAEFLRETVIGF